MGLDQWIVLAIGLAAIVWINWYFFLARTPAVAATEGSADAAEVVVAVRGGYAPATIQARVGRPLRLIFDRQEDASCSEEVVFPDFGIRTFLPAFQRTPVEIRPDRPGTYEFTCGMSMLRGRVVVA